MDTGSTLGGLPGAQDLFYWFLTKLNHFRWKLWARVPKQAPLICVFFALESGWTSSFHQPEINLSNSNTRFKRFLFAANPANNSSNITQRSHAPLHHLHFSQWNCWIRREKEAQKWRLLRFMIHHSSMVQILRKKIGPKSHHYLLLLVLFFQAHLGLLVNNPQQGQVVSKSKCLAKKQLNLNPMNTKKLY